jgi:hypothetical protein
MKQGTGNRVRGDQKVEPTSRAINPGGVNNLGSFAGNHTAEGDIPNPRITPLYGDKGYSAPPIRSITSRKGGSQGSY